MSGTNTNVPEINANEFKKLYELILKERRVNTYAEINVILQVTMWLFFPQLRERSVVLIINSLEYFPV